MGRTRHLLALAGLAAAIAAPARAQVLTVTPTVTPVGSLFHYDYSIANTTPIDFSVVDVSVPAMPGAIDNLMAPSGFNATFDSGLGLVSFLEDTSMFGPTPTSGFTFDSAFAPGQADFQGTGIDAAGNLAVQGGVTLAPAATPEPGSMALALGALASGSLLVRRRRRAA